MNPPTSERTAPAQEEARPADTAALRAVLAGAAAQNRVIELGGRFTKRAMGGRVAPAGLIVSTAAMDRVVEYEPKDLTVSVEPGMRFSVLDQLLAANGQMLPLDPPVAGAGTIGGAVAANCSGPRRRRYGTARDMVIGMSFVTLEGKEVRSGGMVVKNVAGLDMAKLLIGSFGTLAAISRINFRVHPRPALSKTFVLAFDSADAAFNARDAVLQSVLQPEAIDLINPQGARALPGGLPSGYLLLLHTAGIEAVLSRYERELKAIANRAGAREFLSLEDAPAGRLWASMRDFSAPGDTAAGIAVLRVSTPLAGMRECFAISEDAAVAGRAGSGVAYVRCPAAQMDLLSRLRAKDLATVVESCPEAWKDTLELWTDPGPELEVMLRIKQAFDPRRLLNHGRLYNRL